MHAGGGTNYRGEKRNVLIVIVLLLIDSNLTLRSNTQRRIQILRVRQAPVLRHVAGLPKPIMYDAEVKDQTPAPGLELTIPVACQCQRVEMCLETTRLTPLSCWEVMVMASLRPRLPQARRSRRHAISFRLTQP